MGFGAEATGVTGTVGRGGAGGGAGSPQDAVRATKARNFLEMASVRGFILKKRNVRKKARLRTARADLYRRLRRGQFRPRCERRVLSRRRLGGVVDGVETSLGGIRWGG